MSDAAIAAAAPRPGTSAWAAEARATLALGWPIVLTNLAQVAITTTDVAMAGWLGPQALAACTLGAHLYFALLVGGMGLAMATAPMLAQARGRCRHAVRDLRRTVRQGCWLALAYCLPAWALLWHGEAVLLALGQEPALAAAAADYVRTLQWGLLPAILFIVQRSFVAALERPAAAFVVTLLAVGLNAACNWALMFGHWGAPALGLPGAGISSTLANGFMVAALGGFLAWDRRFRRYRLTGRWWRADWPRFRALVRLGLPVSGVFLIEVGVFSAATMLVGLTGAAPLAAHAIALQVASITFMVPLGVAQATTVRVGLAAGRGDPGGVARAGWTALALGGGFMAAMAALLVSVPRALAAPFLDPADPEGAAVAALAVSFITVAAVFQVSDGVQTIGAGALRGLKDTRVPMLLAGTGYWAIGMPLGVALAFAAGLGALGIWIGLASGLAIVAALMLWRWARRERLGLVAAR
ncbi:MAG: MATE family efflux transporter [Alphaproteobacteria bacterium]|nr:MATE family efflux transporter [Alphaproteobacteria bacterium]